MITNMWRSFLHLEFAAHDYNSAHASELLGFKVRSVDNEFKRNETIIP